MNAGHIVIVTTNRGDFWGVVVINPPRATTLKVMLWQPRRGRWMRPSPYLRSDVRPAPASDPTYATIQANIQRHQGVIPCGGTKTDWVRVWPYETNTT